jgi:AAA domain
VTAQKAKWQDRLMTVAELQRKEFPPMTYIVPSVIPEGVTVLAGRPKIGKSWLALELCLGVSCDMPVLGNIKAATGDALYLALEDNPRRLQRRIDKIISPCGGRWPERCSFATTWNKLDKGGAEEIAEWIAVLRRTFELAGVEFIEVNGGGPGVHLRKRPRAKTAK